MKKLTHITIIGIVAFKSLICIGLTHAADNKTAPQNQPKLKTQQELTLNPFAALISKAANGAEVFIIEPKRGATVSSPITVKFGIRNMTVAKAGDQTELSGHHHLLIDVEQLPTLNAPLPATDKIVHFGGAQTETVIELTPGQHTLQLLLGNYAHIPHSTPILSDKISITVK